MGIGWHVQPVRPPPNTASGSTPKASASSTSLQTARSAPTPSSPKKPRASSAVAIATNPTYGRSRSNARASLKQRSNARIFEKYDSPKPSPRPPTSRTTPSRPRSGIRQGPRRPRTTSRSGAATSTTSSSPAHRRSVVRQPSRARRSITAWAVSLTNDEGPGPRHHGSGKPIPAVSIAAGEATGGIHGAVRLGSCAILDCLVSRRETAGGLRAARLRFGLRAPHVGIFPRLQARHVLID